LRAVHIAAAVVRIVLVVLLILFEIPSSVLLLGGFELTVINYVTLVQFL